MTRDILSCSHARPYSTESVLGMELTIAMPPNSQTNVLIYYINIPWERRVLNPILLLPDSYWCCCCYYFHDRLSSCRLFFFFFFFLIPFFRPLDYLYAMSQSSVEWLCHVRSIIYISRLLMGMRAPLHCNCSVLIAKCTKGRNDLPHVLLIFGSSNLHLYSVIFFYHFSVIY